MFNFWADPLGERMSPTALSPLPADWNADVITGTRAAILDHKMEATCRRQSKKNRTVFISSMTVELSNQPSTADPDF